MIPPSGLPQHHCYKIAFYLGTIATTSYVPCEEVEDVVGVLTPVCRGVAQVFHDLLVELRLLLVAEVEEGEKEDRQEEGWEVESGVGRVKEKTTHVYGMEMDVRRCKTQLEP